MNAIGGQEMLMPVLHPAEPWRRTGRYAIEELFKLKDRRGADMVLAMTHEEIVTGHVAAAVRSYRDLPLILYHFQVKERDEPRPRAGRAAHARVHHEGLLHASTATPRGSTRAYQKHIEAYDRMLRPLRPRVVPGRGRRRDDGRDSARTSTWRRAPAGENEVALAPGYAANVEVASARGPAGRAAAAAAGARRRSHTPGMTTIDAVAGAARASPRARC